MVNLRYLNYLIIAFITSGLSVTCFNHVNKSQIENVNLEVKKLCEENEELRKKFDVIKHPKLSTIINNIDDSLTILMKELNETKLETIDEDLKEEIRNICNQVLHTIPEKKLTLEVSFENETDSENEEKENLPGRITRENNTSTDSLSSDDSFDNVSTIAENDTELD